MKILMLSENLRKAGKERRMLELLRSFDIEEHHGIKVKLVILKNVIEFPEIHDLKNTDLLVVPRKIKKDPFVFFRLWKITKSFKPDIIHSFGLLPSVYIFLIAFMQRIPFINGMVADATCPVFSRNWIISRLTIPFSKIVIGNSNAGLRAYGVPAKKGKVIYNGFNNDRLNNLEDKSSILQKYNIKSTFLVGMVAAFQPRKDYDTYLKVAEKLVSKRNDVTFLAIGHGNELENFKEKYKAIPEIIFTGKIDNVESLINCFTIGVLLSDSNVHLEGISNSILEMMALGKPVIATKGGGTDEIILNNIDGITIENKEEDALLTTIEQLLENENYRIILGKKAGQKVIDHFSMNTMTDAYINIYKGII